MTDRGRLRGLSTGELSRKLIHMAVGLGAFTVVFLGPVFSALLAILLLLFNVFFWPRLGGRGLWREQDHRRGVAAGIVLYPLVILVLILVFRHSLEVVAAAWAILAFGDGMATIAGSALSSARLPWNSAKTWLGSLAYWVFGTLGAAAALWWTLAHQAREMHFGFLVLAAVATALVAAFVEAQAVGIDDNLSVPLLSAGFLWAFLQSEAYWAATDYRALLAQAAIGAALTLPLAAAGLPARAIDLSGAIAGVVIGTVIYGFLGWRAWLILVTFVVIGSAVTRLGYPPGTARPIAGEGPARKAGGRRGAGHAIANASVASVVAILAATTAHGEIYLAALTGAFAAALSDTMSSEIGQRWGRSTVLITTWTPVPPGTDGGISLAGTLAGLAGALLIAVLGWAVHFYGVLGIALLTLAGLLGTFADSLAGATLERRGLLDNHAVNLLNTLIGALAAAGLMLR